MWGGIVPREKRTEKREKRRVKVREAHKSGAKPFLNIVGIADSFTFLSSLLSLHWNTHRKGAWTTHVFPTNKMKSRS